MPTLSAEELSILRYHADAGDRIAYYSALGAFGFAYGNLALGVVLNNTVSGAAANSFFLDQAAEQGASVSGSQLATISRNLMLANLAQREQNAGADLTVDDIQNYHGQVFSSVANVSADAWTPNLYLLSFDIPAERQAAWAGMLANGNVATYQAIVARHATVTENYINANPQIYQGLDYVDVHGMNREQMLFNGFSPAFADWFLDYKAYVSELQAAGFDATFFEPSNHYGPFDVTLANGGHMIGGSHTDNSLTGTAGNDVLIGFDGDDTLVRSGGSDRYHGGPGSDIVDYTLHQTAITLQLGPLQANGQEWAPIISQEYDVQAVTHGEGLRDHFVDIESVLGSE